MTFHPTVDRNHVLQLLEETGNAHEVARRMGIHENTVYDIHRKARRRCVRCVTPAAMGKTMCTRCLEQERERIKRRRKQNRHEGLCLECGGPRQLGSFLCAKHRKSNLERNVRYAIRKGVPSPQQRRQTILDRYGPAGNDVWKRDNGTCVICATRHGERPVHIHHIDQDRKHNEAINLVCLCFECHRAIHDLLKSKNLPALLAWFSETYEPSSQPAPLPTP